MTPPLRKSSRSRLCPWLVAVVGLSQWIPGLVHAQPPTNSVTHTNAVVMPMPPMPSGKSPVALFRELLAMTPAERFRSLTNRPPESRKAILAKVREYQSLKPDQRELRLRVTELRWYLFPLMNQPATNRAVQLARVPDDLRNLVEDRLREWDKLSPAAQRSLLQNEAAVRYFAEADQQKTNILTTLSPERREKLEAGVRELQAMPEDQRQELFARFIQFFDLTPAEKDKAMRTLSEPERQQIEKTLVKFGQLPAARRAQCIRSFEKFVNLSVAERQQFLKNAQRWTLMTPDQRQAWRDLVSKLTSQPPLPPGLNSPTPPLPLPPIPQRPSLKPVRAGTAVANNTN
jgi:hypothetical protein